MSGCISVVLATFNGEKFLQKQLDSLLGQTVPPHEVIASDDNSSDSTRHMLARFRDDAPFPVRIIENSPGLGFRENFLQASRYATGDWVAFCDQDDIWHREKLARCLPYINDPEITQIAHRASLIDADDIEIGTFDQGIGEAAGTLREPLHYDVWGSFWGFSMLYRRELLDLVPIEQRFVDYIDPRHLIAHDRWVMFLAQSLGRTVELGERLVAYRQHGGNLYGGGGRARRMASREQSCSKNRSYIQATTQMLEIVMQLPEAVREVFPLFDRAKALHVYAHALQQVERRGDIYTSKRVMALGKVVVLGACGGYRNAHNGLVRWKSIARDLQIAMVS